MNFKLITNERKLEKYISKPNFLFRTIFSENLAGVHLTKTNIVLDKSIYAGFCILDLSKELMYSFLYDVMYPHYGRENVSLCYMDTDSYITEVITPDLHRSMVLILEHFDTSGYKKDNPAYSPANAKLVGKMKDEVNGVHINDFLGIRSKMYCLVLEDENHTVIKRCKGINTPVVRKQLRVEDYRRCITEGVEWYTENTNFRSYKHKVVTRSEYKLSLEHRDDKRHLCEDRISTLAHGHYSITPM